MKHLIFLILWASLIYPQEDLILDKIYNDFSRYTVSAEPDEECSVLRKQLINGLLLSMGRNESYFRKLSETDDAFLGFMEKFLFRFIKSKPEIVKRLVSCHDTSENSVFNLFTPKFFGAAFMEFALYKEPEKFKEIYGSFDMLLNLKAFPDSLETEFDVWMSEDVKVSDHPIDIGEGTYFAKDIGIDRYYLTRTGDRQIEYNRDINSTSIWKVTWKGKFEYELSFKEDSQDLGQYKAGDKVTCRVTEVTDSTYKVLIKTKYLTTDTELVKVEK